MAVVPQAAEVCIWHCDGSGFPRERLGNYFRSFPCCVLCGYLCFQSSHLGQISSCIHFQHQVSPLECSMSQILLFLSHVDSGGEQHSQGRVADRNVFPQMLDSPSLFISVCRVEVQLFCVYQTWIYCQKSLFAKVYHVCPCKEGHCEPLWWKKRGRKCFKIKLQGYVSSFLISSWQSSTKYFCLLCHWSPCL